MRFKQWLNEIALPTGQPAANGQPAASPEDEANAQQQLDQQMQMVTQQDWDDMGKKFQSNLVQGISMQDLSNRVQEFLSGRVNSPHKTQKTLDRMAGQGMTHIQDILNQSPSAQAGLN